MRYDALEVHVELDGETVHAGDAQFHRARGRLTSTTFQYRPDYLARPLAYQLDPSFRLVTGTQQSPGLPGAFADSAPDRWGRNLIAKRERALALRESRRPDSLDDVDYLARVGDVTRQGALRFRAPAGGPFLDPDHAVPRLVRLPELLRAADTTARGGDDYEAVKALLAAGTGSLGGARPKAAVLDDDGRQLIAKFPHHDDEWDVMAWEATALSIGERCGIRVPARRLVAIGGRHVLLVERFDRSVHGGRIGYQSAMTVLEQRDGDTADYIDIVDALSEVSTQAGDDARAIFRRAALNVGLNNTDDHLRNHGFLRSRGGWTLSPVFDVNPNPDPDRRQTTIAGADLPDDEPEGLRELARSCRLATAEARAELARIVDVLESWRDAALTAGVPRHELDRFAPAFTTGIERLRMV